MFYSQEGQDEYLEKFIFKGFKNGFFMDIGAHDGVSINNTLYFEKNNNWTGMNIEANEVVFQQLVKNRPKCTNLNVAVCNNDGTAEFIVNTGYTEMISGLKNYYDPRHFSRLKRENNQTGAISEIKKVATYKVSTICQNYGIKHIDYLSIDVEGAEFDIIKSIDFENVFIDVIDFENNFDDVSRPIIKYLEEKGFIVCHITTDIFMINSKSKFLLL